MALSFDPFCPVLSFQPRGHTNPGPRNERAWILWPTLVYRVVCPEASDRVVNVFEEAVLGMLCAGNCTLEEIAVSLVLDHELIAHIATRDLVDRGFVEENTLAPTAFGKQTIATGAARSTTKSVGFVFQDPWSGRLWPAFCKALPFMGIEYSNKGYPDLLLGGSKGRPWRQHAFCLLPPADISPSKPCAEDILKAAQAARRARRRMSADLYVEGDDEICDLEQQIEAFKEVSFVDGSPAPHFLVTYLYTPHDESGDFDWYVCDPFGLGHSMSFKREVAERVKENARLGDYVAKCLVDPPETDGGIALGRERAEALVLEKLECQDPSPVALAELNEFQLKLLQIERAEAAHDQTNQLIREAFTQARRVLEVLGGQINDRHRDSAVRDVLFLTDAPKNPALIRDLVERINVKAALKVGFSVKGLRRIVRTGAGGLQECADRRARGKLAAEFMLAVHTAARLSDHPFRVIAASAPEFLCDVERLMDICHPSAHAGQAENQRLDEVIDLTFRIARLVLQDYSQRKMT